MSGDITPVLVDAAHLRERVRSRVVSELTKSFPLDLRGRTLALSDVRVLEKDYSPAEQKRALMTDDSLTETVKGTLSLIDADGKTVDTQKNFTLTHLPWFSERHTIIMDGNEYQVANMLRRRPGVYTQRSANGELHTTFNLSKGANFNVTIDPAKAAFYMVYDSTNIPLYPVLRALGVSHASIAASLGESIANENMKLFGEKQELAVNKLYQKLAHESVFNAKASYTEKLVEIEKKLGATAMDPHVTNITLGVAHTKVTPEALLAAARKLLRVHDGHEQVDDSDSLAFKTFHSVDDFLGERIKLTTREWTPKARGALNGKNEIRGNLKPAPFSASMRKFITNSALTAVPTGINPIELIDHSVKVTALGEGGIPSERAIPFETRLTHPTHFGVLDPIRTPECHAEDGEVFTYNGWKAWPTVTKDDLLACRIDDEITFQKPIKLFAEHYSGELHGVKNGKLSYLVTPNHRVLCAPPDAVYPQEKPGAWRIVRADEAHNKPRVFDTGHKAYTGRTDKPFKLPHVTADTHNVVNNSTIEMADWASFMGWYLSEGCVGKHEGRLTHTRISQSRTANGWKCKMIEALLNRLPFTWRYDDSCNEYVLSGKQLATYLEPFGFCEDKFIPEYFFAASVLSRENLLETLLLGDGRVGCKRATGKTYKQRVFCTTSRQLALDVERLAIGLGNPVRVACYKDKREDRYLDVYEVRLLRSRLRQAVPSKGHYFTQKYAGTVYCATVPGGLMYVRRGDSVGHWSGNSGHAGVDIRATIAAHRDEEGNLYTPLMNTKTNEVEFIRAGDLGKHVVAFPHQELKGDVDVFHNGQVKKAPASTVTYQQLHDSHTYSPATSLIPMLRSIQGNRAIMGSKMQTQWLPLVHREVPLVQVAHPYGSSFEGFYGHMIVPLSPVNGTVEKIEDGYVYIRPHKEKKAEKEASDAGLVKVPYQDNFPMPSKTRLHHEISVKVGDKVEMGQRLGDSNFTRDGVLASGINARIAYMPYFGHNSNDAVVISSGFADKLTSEHMYRDVYKSTGVEISKAKHKVYFGAKYQPTQYAKLDDEGVVKKGAIVSQHDLLVAGITKTQLMGADAMLGKISKSLTKPYREAVLTWEHNSPGEVVDVIRTDGQIALLLKTQERMQVGDKLCYDEATDILTDTGWKSVSVVTTQDRVASLVGGELRYVRPSAVHHYATGGRMYEVRTQQIDLFVTEQHRMYVKPRGADTYTLLPASDIAGRRVRYQKNAKWRGRDPGLVTIHGVNVKAGQGGRGVGQLPDVTFDSHTYAMLLGMYVSEGNLVDQPDSGSYGIDITQIKEPNRSQMLERLRNAGIKFNEHSNGEKIRVYSKTLLEHFRPLGKSHEKYLPVEVFGWDRASLEVLFEWLMWGDGHTEKYPVAYTTTSARLADDVQRLCLHIGKAANIQWKDVPDKLVMGKMCVCKRRYDVRIVNTKLRPEVNHGHASTQRGQRERWVEDYAGSVHCVTVPSGVVYVRRNGKPVWSGNSNRYGGKGVVSKIIPDHEMLKDESGKPIELIMTSAGVVSRINPAQLHEALAGKVAEKIGKPILFDNASAENTIDWVENLAKKHNVKSHEQLYDPTHDRTIKGPDGQGVFVGRSMIFKLFKTTDTNFAGHGVGVYDINEQPLKSGGDEGAKGLGKMEVDALVAHNARGILSDAVNIRGQKNDQFWRSIQLGQTLMPTYRTSFAFNKFKAMMEGAGVKVDKRGSKFHLLPMTDADVLARSAGEVKNNKTLIAKNLKPEAGGLFDMRTTGGPQGTLYSHISLHEPVPNPVFEEPIRRLLGMTEKKLNETIRDKGGAHIRDELKRIDVKQKLNELESKVKTAKGSELNDTVKQIKYLRALDSEGLKPHEAYVITKVPVVPPVFRPISQQKNNPSQLMIADANKLYAHLMDVNNIAAHPVLQSDVPKHREALYNAVSAVFGTDEVDNQELQGQNVKGFLTQISGQGTPKGGFFQRKLMKRQQDVSGRGTAVPDTNLHMDAVGLPEQMLWQMLDKLIVARLIRKNYSALHARQMVNDKAPAAKQALMEEIRERPMLINRAPTLHRYGIVAAYATPVQGSTIRVSPFIEKGLNLDYDGDTLQVHAPITAQGVEDAKRMTMSNLLLSDQAPNKLLAFPQHESIIGVTHALKVDQVGAKPKVFNSREEVLKAWRKGDIKLSDPIEVKNEKKASDEDEEVFMAWLDKAAFEDAAEHLIADALSFFPPEYVCGELEEPSL